MARASARASAVTAQPAVPEMVVVPPVAVPLRATAMAETLGPRVKAVPL
ncbi:hypothetical protein LP421_02265 (plasmid) [Rhizobium sp. RCAM05350]|nr:hypothetical protein LP421_02265 [Rhizobium sp. RCAM05350]